jgi:hypothetical protein
MPKKSTTSPTAVKSETKDAAKAATKAAKSNQASSKPPAQDQHIVRAAIHPAIGVARVGNSTDAFFIAPQVAEPAPQAPGFYRDAQGALKREAVEFRLYGYNAAGDVVRELTANDAEISWSAHIANSKAAWYQWQLAMDIPEAATVTLPLRNASLATASARQSLVIDGGLQSIRGKNAAKVPFVGQFTGVSVYLGELQTDANGRLLFLGGHGVSASPANTPIYNPADDNSFINADGWYDDTSDGPVMAEVKINGRAIPVESAWVVTAPPNYAPQVKAERTLYDLLNDLYTQSGWIEPAATLSFTHDIYPILQRLSGLQWVNQGFATQFGHNGRYDFENPAFVQQLASLPAPGGYDPNTELRRQVCNSFRNPAQTDSNQLPWPWVYGDAMTVPAGTSPRQNATITNSQELTLQRWVSGDFIADWGSAAPAPHHIEQVPLAAQPAMLDRAALEFCLADAFHPGCEMTWPMRHLSLYHKPFRIRQRPPGKPAPNYGKTLNQAQCLALNGPLHQQGPGDINRWMGLPWQADTAYCRAGYDTTYDPFVPTFWPARVPNHVLTLRDYALVIDPKQPHEVRVEAFTQRTSWNKPLHGSTAQQMEQMVRIYGSMGLLEVLPGVKDDPAFPQVMMVASYGPDVAPADAAETADQVARAPKGKARLAAAKTGDAPDTPHALPRGSNFASHEEAEQAPLPGSRRR